MIGNIGGMDFSGMMGMQGTQSMQHGKDPSQMFSKIDSNGDGGIDETELQSLADRIAEKTGESIDVEETFSTYDADGDGVLGQDEIESFMKDNAPAPPPNMNMEAQSLSMIMNMFDKIDSNEDGGIDQDELQALADRIAEKTGESIDAEEALTAYDADEDGVLGQEELESFLKDNVPAPPFQMSQALSAYGTGAEDDQLSALLELIQSQAGNQETYTPLNMIA